MPEMRCHCNSSIHRLERPKEKEMLEGVRGKCGPVKGSPGCILSVGHRAVLVHVRSHDADACEERKVRAQAQKPREAAEPPANRSTSIATIRLGF